MAITEERALNELLVRYDDGGVIKGAHCTHLELIVKDGVTIHTKQGTAEPLPLGSDALSDVLTQVQNDALAQLSIEQDKVTNLTSQLESLQAENSILTEQLNQVTVE